MMQNTFFSSIFFIHQMLKTAHNFCFGAVMAVQLLLSEKIPEIFSGNEAIVTHKGMFCGTFQSNTEELVISAVNQRSWISLAHIRCYNATGVI